MNETQGNALRLAAARIAASATPDAQDQMEAAIRAELVGEAVGDCSAWAAALLEAHAAPVPKAEEHDAASPAGGSDEAVPVAPAPKAKKGKAAPAPNNSGLDREAPRRGPRAARADPYQRPECAAADLRGARRRASQARYPGRDGLRRRS